MMRKNAWIGRIVSFVLALGLAGLAFFAYKKDEKDKEEARQEALIFKDEIQKEEAVQIVLKQGGRKSIEIVKNKEEKWDIVYPLQDWAGGLSVENLLTDILSRQAERIDRGSDPWREYHLDPPFAVLSLKNKEGREWSVEVSDEPSFDQRYFLKKDDQLFLGDAQWRKLSRLVLESYRDKSLYRFKRDPVRISYRFKNKNYNFQYQDHQWQWRGSVLFPISSSAAAKFINIFRQDLVQSFLSKEESSKMIQPDLTLKFYGRSSEGGAEASSEKPSEKSSGNKAEASSDKKTETVWSLDLKKTAAGGSYVRVSSRDFVYQLDESFTNKILNADFRDHRAPFRWDLKKLAQIEVQSLDLNFIAEQQEGSSWKAVQPEGYRLKDSLFRSFLDWLGRVSALSYHKKKVKGRQAVRILLKNKEGAVFFQLDLGVEKDESGQFKDVYAQVNSAGPSMSIDAQGFQEAFQPSIIEKVKDGSSSKEKLSKPVFSE